MSNTKYRWPANKITDKEMAILCEWRKKTETPINLLLAQAVTELDKLIKRNVLQGK